MWLAVFVAIQASTPFIIREADGLSPYGSNTAVRTAFPGASVYSMTKGAGASWSEASLSTSRRAGFGQERPARNTTETEMKVLSPKMVKPRGCLSDAWASLKRIFFFFWVGGWQGGGGGMVAYLARPEGRLFTGSSQTIDGRLCCMT